MAYIDPDTCIDCGACVPECPFAAIFPEDEVSPDQRTPPRAASTSTAPYFTGHYEATNHHGKAVVLETTRQLDAGEFVDLTPDTALNYEFFRSAGYGAKDNDSGSCSISM